MMKNTLVFHIYNVQVSDARPEMLDRWVLVLSGMKFIFCLLAGTVMCFEFRMRIMLITR